MAQLRITARPGSQRVDEAAVARIPRSAPVRRDLNRRATRVAAYQRIHIPMRTGRLRSSVRTEEYQGISGAGVRVLVGRGVPYGGYWVFGTGPHEILPRRKKALRFRSGGTVVFTRRVFHPGTPSNVKMLTDSAKYWRD